MAGFISEAIRERVRAASDIVEIIGGYVSLKRAGANFVALCPFHKEKSPSFNVNPSRQIFHCFGCHKGGDVFTFVKEYENIGFIDAVRRLAERAKIPLEMDDRPGEQQARHLKDRLLEIHEQITKRWQSCLENEAAGQSARDYLQKRGVSEEAIKLFRIGAAPESWDDTVNWAKSKGFETALMETAGLIIRKEGTERHYDRFRGRLMFPICDEQGRVIGFSGRILSGDEKSAKYVNSPETPIFTKSKVFFGLDKAKRAILDAEYVIVCEGQLDTIACVMAGVTNVVAPQGTAFTIDHASILKRYAKKVVMCFDSDNAGQNATSRSLDTLIAAGPKLFAHLKDKSSTYVGRLTQRVTYDSLPASLSISVAVIPPPDDPDSFIRRYGVDEFRKLIDHAKEFFDFYLARLCHKYDPLSDVGQQQILLEMGTALQKTASAVLIDKYAQKTALRLGVQPDAVRAEFKKTNVHKFQEVEEEDETAEAELIRPSVQELWLLKLLLVSAEPMGVVMSLDKNWIQHGTVRDILQKFISIYVEQKWRGVAEFLNDCDSEDMRQLITEVTADGKVIPNPEQQVADLLLRLRNQSIDRQIAVLIQRVNQPTTTDDERLEMLRRQQELRDLKRQRSSRFKP